MSEAQVEEERALRQEIGELRARVAALEAERDKRYQVGYVNGYRKGIADYGGRVAALEGLLRECADDLEAEIEHHYDRVKDHPAMTSRYERDMDIVVRARALLDGRAKG